MKPFAICTSHRSPFPQTQKCLQELPFPHSVITGISDTALARNVAFSTALRASEKDGYDSFLFVDDDMVFEALDAKTLLSVSNELKRPTSAIYLTNANAPAMCCQHKDSDWQKCLWLTGLGLLAVPAPSLRQLAAESERLSTPYGEIFAFTWSGPYKGEWSPEDYTFCRRLGGVHVAPIRAGHIKPTPIQVPDQMIWDLLVGN